MRRTTPWDTEESRRRVDAKRERLRGRCAACSKSLSPLPSGPRRNCFLLASTDGTADVAYALASRYENFTLNPNVQDAQVTLMADLSSGGRRLGARGE